MNWKCRIGLHPWNKWKPFKVEVWVDMRPQIALPTDPLTAVTYSKSIEYSGPAGRYETRYHQKRSCPACGRTQQRGVYGK